jgi:hypothetical protein
MMYFLNQNFVPFRGLIQNFPALPVAVSRSVKVSILSFLLLPSLSFSSPIIKQSDNTCITSGSVFDYNYVVHVTGTYATWSDLYPYCVSKFSNTIYNDQIVDHIVGGGIDSPYCALELHTPVSVSCPSCSSGTSWDNVSQTCATPPAPSLSDFNNDPQGCNHAGGYFFSTGTEQVGGTSYGASFFGGSGIMIGGDLKATTKCGTLGDVVGQVATTALSMVPLASRLFGSMGLKKVANLAVLDKLTALPNLSIKPSTFPDYTVGLPRLPAPNSSSMSPIVPISETPIPPSTNSDGVTGASRASIITPDSNYANIPDSFIPIKPSGDAVLDYSIVDRYNAFANISSSPLLAEIVPSVGSSSLPVKETFDFSKIVSGSSSPSTIATVPTTTTLTQTFSGSNPVDNYVTTKNYPDGSSSSQTIKINTVDKTGTYSFSTLSPAGDSSTIYIPISIPAYTGTLGGGSTIQAPSGTTFSPPTTSTPPAGATIPSSTAPTPSTVTNPDTVSGQNASSIINANMPTANFSSLPDFVPFDSNPVTQMASGAQTLFDNITSQISSTKTVFDNTLTLLKGGWTPPVIPQGACGDSMAFNVFHRHVDFCPPLVNETSKISPLVSSVVTLGGMALAVTITLGGF